MSVEFKSEYLKKYVSRLLNKDIVEENDLLQVNRLTINYNKLLADEKDKAMEDLKLFNNLKDCAVMFFHIIQKDISILSSIETLESITFDFCTFDCALSGNYNNIFLNACSKLNLKEMSADNLEILKIIEAKDSIDLKDISKYQNLKELHLLNCNILNCESVLELKSLEKLDLSGSNADNKLINALREKIEVIYQDKYHPTGL